MPEERNWRDATAYDYLSDLDPGPLAWEFLRRNAGYRRDFDVLTTGGEAAAEEVPSFLEKWGLCFRRRPEH
jgi:hypothetical protein